MAKCLKTNEFVIITLSAYWVKCLNRHECSSAVEFQNRTLNSYRDMKSKDLCRLGIDAFKSKRRYIFREIFDNSRKK